MAFSPSAVNTSRDSTSPSRSHLLISRPGWCNLSESVCAACTPHRARRQFGSASSSVHVPVSSRARLSAPIIDQALQHNGERLYRNLVGCYAVSEGHIDHVWIEKTRHTGLFIKAGPDRNEGDSLGDLVEWQPGQAIPMAAAIRRCSRQCAGSGMLLSCTCGRIEVSGFRHARIDDVMQWKTTTQLRIGDAICLIALLALILSHFGRWFADACCSLRDSSSDNDISCTYNI